MTVPCSDASRLRDEPMVATASRVERWVLVEQCSAWGPESVPLTRLAARVARHLTDEARRTGARLVLVRHPKGQPCPPGRSVFVVESRPGSESVHHRRFGSDDELLAARLTADAGWAAFDGPLLLVCTHGRHDRCCATRGRAVAAALALRFPERTWECSHVGGDRFAANVVVLPEGWYLGRVEAPDAAQVVTALLAGRISLPHLRGRSSLPLPVQAAQHAARQRLGRDAVTDLAATASVADGSDAWRVRLAGAGGQPDVEVRVRYERGATEPARLTCSARTESSPGRFVVTDLRTAGAGA